MPAGLTLIIEKFGSVVCTDLTNNRTQTTSYLTKNQPNQPTNLLANLSVNHLANHRIQSPKELTNKPSN
jgi:hypothetical protein